MVAAGLMDDARGMIPRITQLLEAALNAPKDIEPVKEKPTPKAKPAENE